MADNKFGRVRSKIAQLFSTYGVSRKSTSFEDESESGDEELLDITSARLNLMDDREDFCLCRRCRTFGEPGSRTGQPCQANGSVEYPANLSLRAPNADESPVVITNSSVHYNTDSVERTSLLYDSSEDDQADTLHCHARTPARYSSKIAQRQLIASSLTCLAFMTAEIVGGYLSNSLAIMSDAAHLCADLAGFVISIFAVWIAQKSPTKRMSFGFYRAEILGAMVSVVFIWVLTGILVYTAAQRIYHDDYDIDADIMLIVSGTGVAMNIIMGLILHGWCPVGGSHGHSHGLRSSHGHSHSERSNINIRAALIHVLGDLLQSIGVLIAAYVIKYKPEYKIADPICTFVFSALVLFTTVSILRDAVVILMEGFPRDLAYSTVKTALQSLKGVRMAHSLHVWSLTLDRNALAVHLAVDEDADPTAVLQAAQQMVRKKFKIFSSTIQVEVYAPSEMLSCETCKGP
ncbi:zinc transporter 2 isoform X1 [Ixodes scapularis]|uniref:zinc transporter 2 isoform X1 n=1 Tax=Ixodes scapularis TaxID=6945 RepID=UPI001A9EE9C9|nr:zinc transporter 2 isoform X1 [Ixodes scapularis]